MDRRAFLLTSVVGIVAVPCIAQGQAPKIARVGLLSSGSGGPSSLLDAFRQSLRDLGYVEGKSILLDYRFAEAKPERLPDLAAELVRLDVDVILAINTPAAQAAKTVTKAIPIVFTWVVDRSAQPGGKPCAAGRQCPA